MRILIDATPLQTGHRLRGVGTYTRELLKGLLAIDRANEYRLVVHSAEAGRWKGEDGRGKMEDGRGQGEGGERESANGNWSLATALGLRGLPANVSLVELSKPPLGRLTGFATHQVLLPALLARERADLFHSPGFVAAFSVPGLPWRCPLPLVVTLHDFIPLHVPALFNDKAINRWWLSQQMRVAARADRLVCVSEATRQDALRFMRVPQERCVVVHEGVDGQVFHPNPEGAGRGDPPFILFVGGDFPNKNRSRALAAFARLAQATTLPHHMVLVGQDDASDRALARRHPGLDMGRIRRLAGISQGDLAQLYRDADLFLFPSTCEGFGLPVLEAMASGTPVITSDVSSLPEVAGDAALLIDPADVDALTAAMGRVLSDASLRSHLAAAGLRRAAQCTWEGMARETLDVYREVVG